MEKPSNYALVLSEFFCGITTYQKLLAAQRPFKSLFGRLLATTAEEKVKLLDKSIGPNACSGLSEQECKQVICDFVACQYGLFSLETGRTLTDQSPEQMPVCEMVVSLQRHSVVFKSMEHMMLETLNMAAFEVARTAFALLGMDVSKILA